MNLEGKVVLITGGNSGIGRATAVLFVKDGAKVVVAGRRTKEGSETIEALKREGGDALFVRADVTIEEDVKSLLASVIEKYGRLDVAFNNAGTEGIIGPLTEALVSTYESVMDANVKGVFLSMKYQIPGMLKNGGGSIINVSSIAGLIGMAGASLYVASKHAVLGLTRAAALEYAKQGIRVNAVSPGSVQTDMLDRFTGQNPEVKNYLAGLHPMGRIAAPEEIAAAVLWLASPASSFVTGQSLTVDGGFTAQ